MSEKNINDASIALPISAEAKGGAAATSDGAAVSEKVVGIHVLKSKPLPKRGVSFPDEEKGGGSKAGTSIQSSKKDAVSIAASLVRSKSDEDKHAVRSVTYISDVRVVKNEALSICLPSYY